MPNECQTKIYKDYGDWKSFYVLKYHIAREWGGVESTLHCSINCKVMECPLTSGQSVACCLPCCVDIRLLRPRNSYNLNLTEFEFNEFEPRLKSAKNRFQSWNIEYNFKWNQPYLNCVSILSRSSNSLNSASGWLLICLNFLFFQQDIHFVMINFYTVIPFKLWNRTVELKLWF